MEDEDVNLLEPEKKRSVANKRKRPLFLFHHRSILTIIIVTATIGVVFSTTAATSEQNTSHPSFFNTVRRIVTSADKELVGEDSDRINFLLLGIGGAGHDGPELTDTIIFSSIRPSTREIGMMSIPRDLTVPIKGYGWRKINHVNAYGEQEEWGHGPELAAETIGEVLEQPVHYWAKVDFSGFEQLIDAIGGIDVYVDRTFTDPTYPLDDGEGNTTSLEFEEGWQNMDGELALKFVRSRHGNNSEGSDFARARRQQKVLLAVKKKVLSAGTLLNPARISRIIDTLRGNIQTNISTWEMIRLANLGDIFDTDSISNIVLDTRPDGPLYETTANGAYVILPKNNDWTPIQHLAENIFSAEEDLNQPLESQPRYVRVEIQNATGIVGLATQTAQILQSQGYEVVQVGNSATREESRTTIYDLSNGDNRAELLALQDFLSADVSLSAPGWLFVQEIIPDKLTITNKAARAAVTDESIDFLIVLGQSSANIIR
ncbi:MAG: LCP family protein [bacterium]|nr:LCP family protein [bacterium]